MIQFLITAASAGAFSLITPCVFPMIPITVSYFTKRNEKENARPVRDAFIYALSIILTFTLLGVLFSIVFGASGLNNFGTNPYVNLIIAGIFIFFAMNLFGWFELHFSGSFLNKLQSKSQESGWISLVFMAITFTVTTFTCTMPFIGTILVTASQGDVLYPIMGMLAFSIVFSIPFYFLAIFPGYLKRLPKSGNWMYSFKIVMGFLELAAALKFLSNVDLKWQLEFLTRDMFLAIWASIALATSLYLFKVYSFRVEGQENSNKSLHPIRVMLAIIFMALAIDFSVSITGKSLGELDAFLPPVEYGQIQKVGASTSRSNKQDYEKLVWLDSYEKALSLIQKGGEEEGKRIFIDFTGYTCTNCRWMEKNIFNLADVKNLLKQFVLVQLYTDGSELVHEKNQKFQETKFKTVVLPFYAIVDSNEVVVNTFEGMTRTEETFIKFLNSK